MADNFIDIPTWEVGQWTTTSFTTRKEFRNFLVPLFKEPGEYNFDDTAYEFNAMATKYNEKGYFCAYPEGSRDFKTFWDFEKQKCRNGVLFKGKDAMWYLPREYYMWINYLPINNKVLKKFRFPDVWDSQLHMALYELLAELFWTHAAVLKKRQFGSSYYHCAKFINQIWFEETPILKIGSSKKDYINEKGSWKFFDEYKSFLDTKTAWYRPMNPGKVLMWQQQLVNTDYDGRESKVGLKGTIQGVTFDQSDTAGVGGALRYFFYEEAGVAPTMDKTVEYLFPALKLGEITTGTFIAAGTVGDLDQCNPLKKMILHPEVNSIYAVNTNLLDEKGTIGTSGLFIPEQWSMPPYIDTYGNSIVHVPTAEQAEYLKQVWLDNDKDIKDFDPECGALKSLEKTFALWKKELEPATYQLRVSQQPRNIAEAFAFRNVSLFPQHLVSAQKRRIEDKDYAYELIELSRTADGTIEAKLSNKIPINEFPITMKTVDKTGCLTVWERPDPKAETHTYYASVDPVSEGKTVTSDSLCSIFVYKNPVEVTRTDGVTTETFIERDKIVASWCGRFDDIKQTHERLELIIEWYRAWTVIENNISLFIQYMISKHKQQFLVPKDQIIFLKDLGANKNVFQDYGWKNTGTLFKTHLLSYFIEFLKEELDTETKEDGTIVKTVYGIERIPDIMVMEEMQAYDGKVNVDRLVAIAALIAFAKVQQAGRGYKKRLENTDRKHLDKSSNLFKLNSGPFRHIGGASGKTGGKMPPRNPYKNLR